MIKIKGKSGYVLTGQQGERRWHKRPGNEQNSPIKRGPRVIQAQLITPLSLDYSGLNDQGLGNIKHGIRDVATVLLGTDGKKYYAKKVVNPVREVGESLLGRAMGLRVGKSLYLPNHPDLSVASEIIDGKPAKLKQQMDTDEKIALHHRMMFHLYDQKEDKVALGAILPRRGKDRGLYLNQLGIRGKDYDTKQVAEDAGALLFLNTMEGNYDTTIRPSRITRAVYAGPQKIDVESLNFGVRGNTNNVLIGRDGRPNLIDLDMAETPVMSFVDRLIGGQNSDAWADDYETKQYPLWRLDPSGGFRQAREIADADEVVTRLHEALDHIDYNVPRQHQTAARRGFRKAFEAFSELDLNDLENQLRKDAFAGTQYEQSIGHNTQLQDEVWKNFKKSERLGY